MVKIPVSRKDDIDELETLPYVATVIKIVGVLLTIAALLAISRLCHGAEPLEASYKVTMASGSGGSGTAIHARVVVTNSHVVDHMQGLSGTVASPRTGEAWRVDCVAVDQAADLALLLVRNPQAPPLKFVELADRAPRPGEAISIYGYGMTRELRTAKGVITSDNGRRSGNVPVLVSSILIEPGDSGSGLFDADGRLAGVNWGGEGSTTGHANATPVENIVALVQRYQASCGPGGCTIIRQWPNGRQVQVTRPVRSSPPMVRVPPVSPSDPTIADLRKQVADLQAALRNAEAQATSAGASAATVSQSAEQLAAEQESLRDRLKRLAAEQTDVLAILKTLPDRYQQARRDGAAAGMEAGRQAARSIVEEQLAEGPHIGAWTKAVPALIGVGGPIGAGLGVGLSLAGWFARQRIRKRYSGAEVAATPFRQPAAYSNGAR